MSTDKTIGDLHLWLDGGDLRWWTPQDTGLLDNAPPTAPSLSELQDPDRQTPLRQVLAADIAQVLTRQLERFPTGLRLHLGDNLPQVWQHLPLECLTLNGRRLTGRLVVNRYVPHPHRPAQIPDSAQAHVLDLWPRDEAVDICEPLQDLPGVQMYPDRAWAENLLDTHDAAGLPLLCVVAHGTENDPQRPVRLPDGRPWAPPLAHTAPAVVLLLLCGGDGENLMEYGHRLLELGTQAVIVPAGRPDAFAAREFLPAFLAGWHQGTRLDELLRRAQALPGSEGCARQLRLLGRGDLHAGPTLKTRDWPDPKLADAYRDGNDDALVLLADRCTLEAFRQNDPLQVWQAFYWALDIRQDNASQERPLLQRLYPQLPRLWPLTRAWAGPLLLYLSDAYDHRLMQRLDGLRDTMAKQPLYGAGLHHFLAKSRYRKGRYALAVEELAQGFALLSADTLCRDGLGVLGLLMNILIDLNLPRSGRTLYRQLDQCLARGDSEFIRLQQRNRLDRSARLDLRSGQVARAIGAFRRKWHQERQAGQTGHRELCWLLYVSAWCRPDQAAEYLPEAMAALADEDPVRHSFATKGQGNFDLAYMLRALALWAWRGDDNQAYRQVMVYADLLRDQAAAGDPGPFGLAIAYLNLYHRAHPEQPSPPEWEEVQPLLEADHYYLELMVLDRLLGDRERSRQSLDRCQQERQAALAHLCSLPAWLGMTAQDWTEEVQQRTAMECSTLDAAQTPDAGALLAAGLLPQ